MKLSDKEVAASNEKSLALYKALVENGSLGAELGISVSIPPHMDKGVQLTLPCLPDRKRRKKTSAMQKRTGAQTISIAKEVTKYDHLLDRDYQDYTDYEEFNAQGREADEGTMIKSTVAAKLPSTDNRGVLDL